MELKTACSYATVSARVCSDTRRQAKWPSSNWRKWIPFKPALTATYTTR